MPTNSSRKLTHAASELRRWTEARNELIRQRHAEGATLRTIAGEAGLTHSGVAKILLAAEN